MARATHPVHPSFEPARTREVLRSALEGPADSGGRAPEPRFFFVPLRHIKAIDPSYPLVVGGRGAGKSVWWNALRSPEHRDAITQVLQREEEQGGESFRGPMDLLRRAQIVAGYGENPELLEPSLPTKREFAELREQGYQPEVIWRAIIAWLTWADQADSPLQSLGRWSARASWIRNNQSDADARFAGYERALAAKGALRLILFDSVDRSAESWEHLREITRGLLSCLLDFRNYRSIRLKVFLRPDILGDPQILAFPDASKLKQNRVDLRWEQTDLYTLIWQRLANAGRDGEFFRKQTHRLDNKINWLEHPTKAGIWVVPGRLRNEPALQANVLHAITGPRVGSRIPYRWLIQELKDSTEQVSPRSLLNALRVAAEVPGAEDSPYAIHARALEHGLREAAVGRTDEIGEDFPWIGEAIKALRDLNVPADFDEIKKLWQKKDVLSKIQDVCKQRLLPRRFKEGAEGLRLDLLDIGLFTERRDGRIDVPEVARIGFGLRRYGGVRPSKPAA